MITKEHLDHWLDEILYQLKSIDMEVSKEKLKDRAGIGFATGPLESDHAYVSFEYLREKAGTIRQLVDNVKHDMEHDKEGT